MQIIQKLRKISYQNMNKNLIWQNKSIWSLHGIAIKSTVKV